jgi:hypothetical protein
MPHDQITSPAPGSPAAGGLPPGGPVPREQKTRLNLLQALGDAIVYREARLARRCRACRRGPGTSRCDEHAVDVHLIGRYETRAREISDGRLVLDPMTAGEPGRC